MSNSARTQSSKLENTNRWSTKQLVTMALMCAIAILLSFLEFPNFPAASFLPSFWRQITKPAAILQGKSVPQHPTLNWRSARLSSVISSSRASRQPSSTPV